MKNRYGFTESEQIEINNIVRYYGLIDYGKKLNLIKTSPHESLEHMRAKCNLCCLLRREKIPFLTEFAIKKNIPDILVLRPLFGIEILHSEKPESFTMKTKKAPNGLLLIQINSEDAEEIDTLEGII